MQLSVKHKTLGLAAGAAVLPVAVMVGLAWDFKSAVVGQAAVELKAAGKVNLAQIAHQVYALCEMANAEIQPGLDSALRTVRNGLTRGATPASVEAIARITGGTVTLLRRTSEPGDLEVAATSVTDPARRAIGASIPAVNPSGDPNPLAGAILRGEEYHGPAELFDPSPLIACAPLKEAGRVSGAVCVGASSRLVEALRNAVAGARVGATGYVVVIGAKGNRRGRLLVAQSGRRDGESIWESRDARGNYFVQGHVAQALQHARGEVLPFEYPWKNPGEETARNKMAAEIYYEPWDWLINAGTFEDEYYGALGNVNRAFNGLLARLALAAAASLALVLWCAVWLSGRLARPLAVSAEVARSIAGGDIRRAHAELTGFAGSLDEGAADGDEGHALIRSFATMAGNLDGLIGQVRKSTLQVNTSALEIAASARQLEATVAEQASSTREVSAASQEISATSADLLATMSAARDTVAQAGEKTESRHTELQRMEEAMRSLLRSTGSISSRLGIISDRANKISGVVTTINKISDQTSLLALNAAIEAEKAGEYGKGFSVVAREISRLADQTAVATQDIEAVIREMQSSVSSGVMEMDKFAKEVEHRTAEASTVAQQLDDIIHDVQALLPRFEAVNEGMEAQTQGARQISDTITHLSQGADQTRQSLHEFKLATEQLNGAVQELQVELAHFQISG